MQDDLLYLQSQSMRNNLMFANIPEQVNETPVQCESKLRDFMTNELKIAQDIVDEIKFERVHRVTPKSTETTPIRNIVAKFTLYKDRELVRRQSRELTCTSYFVFEQFPREISERRKSLLSQLKAAKRDNKQVWLSYDKLFIDGRQVSN